MQGIHASITMLKNRELFETDFIVQDVLCLFDTG